MQLFLMGYSKFDTLHYILLIEYTILRTLHSLLLLLTYYEQVVEDTWALDTDTGPQRQN